IGRERELAALMELARRAAASEGSIAFVSGDAGAGKTRIVDELCRHLPRGMHSYRAACLEYAPSPMGPIAEILAALDGDRVVPAEGAALAAPTGDDPVDKRRLFERVAATLRAAGSARPLVAVVDDAHWADTVTLDLLQFLVATLHDARVLIVVVYRTDEVSETHPLHAVLARAARARNVQRIELGPLDHAQIHELIDATLPKNVRLPVESLRGVRDRSEGNPLFAEEFLKAVVDDERSGEVRLTLPPSLRGLLVERLRRVTPEHMRLLEIAALIGRRFGAAFLARIGGIGADALAAFLRIAVDEHFLVEDGDEPGCFAFRHALTRDTIVDGVLAMHARAMHLLIAREIEREPDRDGRVVELAEHYWRAAAFSECAAYAQTAGDVAKARHAYAEAASLYERALACGVADQHGLVVLHEKAASAYASLGAPQKVLDHLDVAVDHYTATGELGRLVEVYLDLALALRRMAKTERAFAVLHRAAEMSKDSGNDRLLLKSAVQLAQMNAIAEHWDELAIHLRAAEPLLAIAEPRDAVRFHTSRAALHLARHELDGWRHDSEQAASIARTHGDPTFLAFALTNYGIDARKVAHFDDASAAFREVIDIGRTHAGLYNVTFARLVYANVLYLTGRLAAARNHVLEVLADVHESVTIRGLIAQFGVAIATVLRDDTLSSRCYSPNVVEDAFLTGEPTQYAPLAATVAEYQLAKGEPVAAVMLLERMLAALPDDWNDGEPLLAVAVCCPQEDVERARALLRHDAGAPDALAAAYRELFDAYAAARFGNRETKLRHAGRAAGLLERLGIPLLEAEAYELAEQPKRAVALRERIGALRPARRLGPPPQRRSSATQLTAREREVVELVLRGLSNSTVADALSLSERTVEAHVAAAYRKLGVRSRGELANVMAETSSRV
ncbi:MAG TPA: AAA family ATPase, partial [Candidatus Elarobacter sp.]|nr:AAA family ATPase [Candidatus Elarobacter sp.]